MSAIRHLILVDDLQAIIVDILFIYQLDVLGLTIIHLQRNDISLALNHLRLVLYGHLLVADVRQQTLPLCIAQLYIIQLFQLQAQVAQQPLLIFHLHIFIALPCQLVYQCSFQLRLTLVTTIRLCLHLEVRHHCLVLLLYYDFIVVHKVFIESVLYTMPTPLPLRGTSGEDD